MSSLRKLARQESAAYSASQDATRAVVIARLDHASEDDIARLSRRAAAHRAQWLKLAARLELADDRARA